MADRFIRPIRTKTTKAQRDKAAVAIRKARRLQADLDALMDVLADRDHFTTLDLAKGHDALTRTIDVLNDVVINRRET
jgi:16S rRNA C1402 (ribose-2'-O) methylase RsmI